MNDIYKIIEKLELDYIEYTGVPLEERKKLLPLKNRKQIKGLIHNLLKGETNKQISYNDYSKILDVWLDRLNCL